MLTIFYPTHELKAILSRDENKTVAHNSLLKDLRNNTIHTARSAHVSIIVSPLNINRYAIKKMDPSALISTPFGFEKSLDEGSIAFMQKHCL
jgi:hypothetical protein